MGKSINGMFGAFIGKIGNLVGYHANGQFIIRSVPARRKGKVSISEKSNRKKFALVQAWFKPITDFVRVGFKNYGTSTGGYKAAVSYALRNAVKGDYPDQYIDPELIKVCGGELHFPELVSLSVLAGNLLQFLWSTEVIEDEPYDQAMLLAYHQNERYTVYKETAAFRYLGIDTLQLHAAAAGSTYHIYIGFVAQDRSRQSDSQYLGKIILDN